MIQLLGVSDRMLQNTSIWKTFKVRKIKTNWFLKRFALSSVTDMYAYNGFVFKYHFQYKIWKLKVIGVLNILECNGCTATFDSLCSDIKLQHLLSTDRNTTFNQVQFNTWKKYQNKPFQNYFWDICFHFMCSKWILSEYSSCFKWMFNISTSYTKSNFDNWQFELAEKAHSLLIASKYSQFKCAEDR